MRKKEVLPFVVILISLLFIIGGVMFLTMFEPRNSLSGMAAGGTPGPPGGSPPGGGGGGAPSAETTTTTITTPSGGTKIIKPVRIVFEYPQDKVTLRKGIIPLFLQGYEGDILSSGLDISIISSLFETTTLINDFEERGVGRYGANVTINQDTPSGSYELVAVGEIADSIDQQRIIVTLDPTITFNVPLLNQYEQGQQLVIEGTATYFNQELVGNLSINAIALNQGMVFLNRTLRSDAEGRFSTIYPLSFADLPGNWTMRLNAEDQYGNQGHFNKSITIAAPSGVLYYRLSFLSPVANTDVRRGEIVPITVKVEEGEKAVTNASVSMRTPPGDMLFLKEVETGVYSTEYKITANDPLGMWILPVQAAKTKQGIIKAGGNSLPLRIQYMPLKITLLEPTQRHFFTGQRVELKVEVSYSDGTAIKDTPANISIMMGNNTIPLFSREPGTYATPYVFTSQDTDLTSLQLYGTDIFNNYITSPPLTITVKKVGPYELKVRLFYSNQIIPWLEQYGYYVAGGMVFLLLVSSPFLYTRRLRKKLRKTYDDEKRTIDMEKDTQIKYFKHHSITREDYDKLMLKYRERASDLKEKRLMLEKKLGRKEK